MLQSDLVNWFLKLMVSKGGILVRWAVGYIIAAIAARHIVPDGDLSNIQGGLEQGGYALVALAYAGLQYWINERNKSGVKVIQAAINMNLAPEDKIPVDGHAGNRTLSELNEATTLRVSLAALKA